MAKKKSKDKGGRPTKMTPETLMKLRNGFLMGFSDEEACAYAKISTSTLYSYQEDEPKFAEQKSQWKKDPILKAKYNVYKSLEGGDTNMSKWYLERKAKDEFSDRQELTGKDGKDLPAPILGGAKED